MSVIAGWGITDTNVPCWRLRGPWVAMWGGEVRDFRGPFASAADAVSAQKGHQSEWEIEPGYTQERQIWRNYTDGTPADLIRISPEQDAKENGYSYEWVSPSWMKAIPG